MCVYGLSAMQSENMSMKLISWTYPDKDKLLLLLNIFKNDLVEFMICKMSMLTLSNLSNEVLFDLHSIQNKINA